MSSINIRFAEDSDNEKIMALAHRCPQEGMISFFVNRTPRFNTLHRLLDPGAWHMVACKDEEIVGLVGVIHFQAKVLGKNCKIGYMLDLRVDEAYRSGMAAFRLVKTAVDHLMQSDVDMVIVNFLKDNKRPLVFTSGRGGLPVAHYLGDNRVFNLLPLHKMPIDKRFTIEKPTEEDIPELLELYRNYASAFKIAPLVSEDHFRKYMNSIEGISLDNFLVARENGKIKAMVATWDEHTYKSYQVLKLNFTIGLVSGILKFLSMFMKVPQPVRINEPLRQLSLVFYAHDNCPEALDNLIRQINNSNLGSEYTLITFYIQENNPILSLMKNYKVISVKSEMHLFAKDTSIFKKLQEDPSCVMFDLALIL